jgi:hypothetical protein
MMPRLATRPIRRLRAVPPAIVAVPPVAVLHRLCFLTLAPIHRLIRRVRSALHHRCSAALLTMRCPAALATLAARCATAVPVVARRTAPTPASAAAPVGTMSLAAVLRAASACFGSWVRGRLRTRLLAASALTSMLVVAVTLPPMTVTMLVVAVALPPMAVIGVVWLDAAPAAPAATTRAASTRTAMAAALVPSSTCLPRTRSSLRRRAGGCCRPTHRAARAARPARRLGIVSRSRRVGIRVVSFPTAEAYGGLRLPNVEGAVGSDVGDLAEERAQELDVLVGLARLRPQVA